MGTVPAGKAGIPEHPQQQLPAAETTSALFLIIGLKITKDAYVLRRIDGKPSTSPAVKNNLFQERGCSHSQAPWPCGMDALCSIHRHHRAGSVVPEHE